VAGPAYGPARRRILVNLETIEKKNYTKGRGHMCPSDGFVCFRNSELLTGRLGKATLGDGNKDGLFHVRLVSELRRLTRRTRLRCSPSECGA